MDPLPLARSALADCDGVFVVGGRVRDELLGRPTLDTDLTIPHGALDAARRVAASSGGAFVALDETRDVGRVVWPTGDRHAVLDIAAYVGPSIEEDLQRRDLTINAMAVPLQSSWPPDPGRVLDPTAGQADLHRKLVRATAPGAFDADPLRMLRAVRLSAQLGFTIESATRVEVRERSEQIQRPAPERVRDELLKTLATPQCSGGLENLADLGLLDELLPELRACRGVRQSHPHTTDVYAHTMAVVRAMVSIQSWIAVGTADAIAPFELPSAWHAALAPYRERLRDHLQGESDQLAAPPVLLRFAALLHDIGKPSTAEATDDGRVRFLRHEAEGARLAVDVCARLRMSTRENARVETIVRHHPRPLALAIAGGASRRAVYRFFEATGPMGVDVVLHALADNVVKAPLDTVRAEGLARVTHELLQAWYDERTVRVDPPPLVDGIELMRALSLEPGPRIGRLLAAVREAQAVGEVTHSSQALAWVTRLNSEIEAES